VGRKGTKTHYYGINSIKCVKSRKRSRSTQWIRNIYKKVFIFIFIFKRDEIYWVDERLSKSKWISSNKNVGLLKGKLFSLFLLILRKYGVSYNIKLHDDKSVGTLLFVKPLAHFPYFNTLFYTCNLNRYQTIPIFENVIQFL